MSDQGTVMGGSGSSRGRKPIKALSIIVGGLLLVGYAAIGWYVSGEIISSGLRTSPYVVEYDTDVVSIDDDEITIRVPDEESIASDHDAVMGLRWEDGYGQVGPATVVEATSKSDRSV